MDLTPTQLDNIHDGYKQLTKPPDSRRSRDED